MTLKSALLIGASILVVGGATILFVGGNQSTPADAPPVASAPATQMATSTPIEATTTTATIKEVPTIGYVTRHHAAELVNTIIKMSGYMLKREKGYIIISDEKVDIPNPHDLPVTGNGVDLVKSLKKYTFTGKLVYQQLNASNQDPYSLQLITPPVPVTP
jgi:hypothetical protein